MAKSVERDHVDDFLESIRDELPDLDFEVEGIVDRIMGLSRRIKRMMEETCAEHGLTWGEWKVLGYLHRQAGPTRRASPGQLAERLELSSGAMTNRLDRLEEAGLIERLRDPDDRRGVQVELTAAGREAYEQTTTAQAGEGGPGRFGAQCAREEGPERAPSPHDDHVRGLRAGSTLMGAIQARDLVRTYKTSTGIFRRRGVEVQAVRGVSFEVADGELFGLLGPNGAGKTTTIKMLITLLIPTSGSASVLGYDVVRDAREVRKRIGYVFGGDRGLYERLSALDNLRYFAELYAVPPAEQKRRIAELLDLVGLAGREKERVEGYSRGMRQRLHIARGLLHDPPVVFLDEPTIGVDPVGARELRRTIAGLTEAGKTVLLTTHYMFEADDSLRPNGRDRQGRDRRRGHTAGFEGDRRRPDGDRDRDVRSRRGRGRPRTSGGRGHLGLDRGARSGAGAARAVARGDRADPAVTRVARHDPHRTCRGARADARGRVCGARRPGRMIVALLRLARTGGTAIRTRSVQSQQSPPQRAPSAQARL